MIGRTFHEKKSLAKLCILILSVTLSNSEKIKCPSNIKVVLLIDPINTGSWNKPQHELMHDIGKFTIIFH